MIHREIYNAAREAAKKHKELCDQLGEIENKEFGFEFADTDSDRIIDTINYGHGNCGFEKYLEEMKFYKKSYDENDGDIKANGVY